jgi:hypothetical protein
MAIDNCVENVSDAFLNALVASTPKRRPRDNPRTPIPAVIQDEIGWKPDYEGSGRGPGTPLWEPRSTNLQRLLTRRLNE